MTGDLKRIDSRAIPNNQEEIRVFMIVWNELIRLDSTLQHYRRLGVNRFFIVDGGSTDGTLDYLAAASDVHLFSAERDDGIGWINSLLDTFGLGHWTLTVDPGDLFVYPHYEELELPLFCRYLDYVGSEAVSCVSFDMYAASPVRDAIHRPGAPLPDTCPYFDVVPYRTVQTQVFPFFEIYGGVRERCFRQTSTNPPPVLSRVPLVRWQRGTRYLRGTANITPVALASVMGALLRFEFLSDFDERAPNGVALTDGLSTNLYSDNSVRFENSAQLVQLGLMQTSRAYEESVQLTAAARSVRSA